jgi:iron complex outermembrane receptor protein
LEDTREAVNVEAGFRITERVRAYFESTYSDAPHSEIGPVYSGGYTHYETDSFKTRIEAETRLALIEASFYKNDIVATIASSANLVLDNELEVAQVEALAKIGAAHTLRLSLSDRHSGVPTTPVAGAKVFYDVISLSAMWEWAVADSVVLTNAVRFDALSLGREGATPPGYPYGNAEWDRDYDATSFNSGVVWSLPGSDVLRFTIARGVQLPSLFNLGGVVIPTPPFGYFSGVPTLEPAIVSNYEVSWSRELAGLGARLRVGAFRGRTEDVIAGAGGADFARGIIGTPANIGNSHMHGLEVAIDGEHESWRWGASYTPLAVHDRFTPGLTVATTQTAYEETTPRHVLRANLGWARGAWEIDGYLRYQSSIDGIVNPNPLAVAGELRDIASYVSIDGRVGYRFNERMLVAIAGQGLSREDLRETAPGGLVERRLLATFRVSF